MFDKIKENWLKIAFAVGILTTIGGWFANIDKWWDMEVNYFIEHSKIERVEVRDCKIIVTYYTAPLPNIDYTTEYWLVPVHDARASYVLEYHDKVKKNQFPNVIYETHTRWTGDGIDIPCSLPKGEYEIHVKYYFKGVHTEAVMQPIVFTID